MVKKMMIFMIIVCVTKNMYASRDMHTSQNNSRHLLFPQLFARQSAESREIPVATMIDALPALPVVQACPSTIRVDALLSRNEELHRRNQELERCHSEFSLEFRDLQLILSARLRENDNLCVQLIRYRVQLENEIKDHAKSKNELHEQLEDERKSHIHSKNELEARLSDLKLIFRKNSELYKDLEKKYNILIQENHALQTECDNQEELFDAMKYDLTEALEKSQIKLEHYEDIIDKLNKIIYEFTGSKIDSQASK